MKLKNFLTALVSTFALTALLDTASVTVNASAVLVTFTSNGNDITDYGFVLNYNATVSNVANMCSGVTIIPGSQVIGVISDKTVDSEANYAPNKQCQFINFRPFSLYYIFLLL